MFAKLTRLLLRIHFTANLTLVPKLNGPCGAGLATLECCGNKVCKDYLCQLEDIPPPPVCLVENAKCGESGSNDKFEASGTCCDGLQCRKAGGSLGGSYYCIIPIPPSQPPLPPPVFCIAEAATCGQTGADGVFVSSGTCCNGNECLESTEAPGTFTCQEPVTKPPPMCLAESDSCGDSYEPGKLEAFGTCCDSMQCLESSDPNLSSQFYCQKPGTEPPPVLEVCFTDFARCGMKDPVTGSVTKTGTCCEGLICNRIGGLSMDGSMYCV